MTQESQIVLPFASLSGRNLQADFDGDQAPGVEIRSLI
jgi:hypothetical protein